MGGGGKGGAAQKASPGETGLAQIMQTLMTETAPLRKEVLSQTEEALTTGGIGARLPIVQKGVEASKAATAQALVGNTEDLARGGMKDSSFGRMLQANTRLQGDLATAAIPQDVAMQFIGVAPSLINTLGGQAIQAGAGNASAFDTRQGIIQQGDIAKGQEQTKMITSIISAAAIACWIAETIYGGKTVKWAHAYYWINYGWTGHTADLTRALYRRFGQRVARHRWFCMLLKPLFDIAVRKGAQADLDRIYASVVGWGV